MSVLLLVTLIGQMCGQVGITAYGVMDEMLVTAPNVQAAGMLPEVVVTAPRYEGEDISMSGMLPEILATAPRYDTDKHDGDVTVFKDDVSVHYLGITLF